MCVRQSRQATNHLLSLIEEGILDRDLVISAFLDFLSDDDVAIVCVANQFFYPEEENA